MGTKLDAKDRFGRWYEGTIIAMHGENQVRVHFDGWNSNFDELIVRSAERLARYICTASSGKQAESRKALS